MRLIGRYGVCYSRGGTWYYNSYLTLRRPRVIKIVEVPRLLLLGDSMDRAINKLIKDKHYE